MAKNINFALVEDVRPPIYTAMKYWGKKPHNIWRTYIETYTPKNGVYLDPFAGSAISAFEAIKAGRKVIAFDLNPLTSFIVEVFTTKFDRDKFRDAVDTIVANFDNDLVYNEYFTTESRRTKGVRATVQSFKWRDDQLYELGIELTDAEISGTEKKRYIAQPIDEDNEKARKLDKIKITDWYPDERFHTSPSFSANFLNCIGGNNFSNLWTKRNLYINAKLFDQILKVNDNDLKKQLLFGFIQSIHLCTKMSVPRRLSANRPFSTSWGRSAYICAARKMEMNALRTFQSSCFGKQSVESCLEYIEEYLGKLPKTVEVSYSHKNKKKAFELKYGKVDVNTLADYIDKDSVDFIMTDPPYGGLVQYFDLSSIWLNWLKKYNVKYQANFAAEITIKPGIIDLALYQRRFTNSIKMLYKVLKPKGKIVFTFHNKDIKIWNAFLKSIKLAGFKVEKVIHQQNRRTGESNVANPYGTSATDFYIRCVKAPFTELETDKDEFEHFVITKAIEIIALRNEPTPYQFLFNGLLPEISIAGFDVEDFDANLKTILQMKVGEVFKLTNNEVHKAGSLWWFEEPKKFIKYPDRMLSDRVKDSVVSLLRRKNIVDFDEVLAEIFVNYPNGLTPDIKAIGKVLERYATKSGGKWLYNSSDIEQEFTKHTKILFLLSKIGKKIGYKVFIGRREQPEQINNTTLGTYADLQSLAHLRMSKKALSRVEMIDMVWCSKKGNIKYAIEVENSTNFTSGVQRASNLDKKVPKMMVVPDNRQKEFEKMNDPLFVDSFNEQNWEYIFYSDIEKLAQTSKVNLRLLGKFTKKR